MLEILKAEADRIVAAMATTEVGSEAYAELLKQRKELISQIEEMEQRESAYKLEKERKGDRIWSRVLGIAGILVPTAASVGYGAWRTKFCIGADLSGKVSRTAINQALKNELR